MENRIPVSPTLHSMSKELGKPPNNFSKKRLVVISSLAVLVAVCASLIAKFLVFLIAVLTNISFFGQFSTQDTSPALNMLGAWVIIVPVVGGLIVGMMAFYGSAAIRGHGIPEAMERILTGKSKIKPTITYLKPISSAIAIGTGGPFGAEGPIIATGGALGSTLGQLIRITHYERKIILAAGATAGMSAIFGTPIAAIFLAIELLLFEFSPRSIIPVALACITGAAGHHFLFHPGPVFQTDVTIDDPGNIALAIYSMMGIVMGLFSVLTTKVVYYIEDLFEKLPIHWMWWPALGGLVVGVVGYFFPRTLGVGYNNITDVLSGGLTINILLSICIMKFVSWSFALGSGTSGGTLAPLLTIGGAIGALLGTAVITMFPDAGISIPLSALVGMSALFAGASRAFLTSVIFALETTSQSHALLPLLATTGASYIISYLLMKNTIMTEKIARRGIRTPDSYEPDLLEHTSVGEVMENTLTAVESTSTIRGLIELSNSKDSKFFIVKDDSGKIIGILNKEQLEKSTPEASVPIESLLIPVPPTISEESSLRNAVENMAHSNSELLLVVAPGDGNITGYITIQNIFSIYGRTVEDHVELTPDLSLSRGFQKIFRRS